MMKSYIFLLIGLILLSKCDDMSKNIDIGIPDPGRKIVVNSLFSKDSLIIINLTKSRKILDNSATFEPITNATISLFENNILIESLKNNTRGYYTSSIRAKTGKTYKINVYAQDLPVAEASSTIPVPVSIVLVDTTYVDLKPQQFLFNKTMYGTTREGRSLRCRIKIKDPSGLNHYSLSVRHQNSPKQSNYLSFCFDDPGFNDNNYLEASTDITNPGNTQYSLIFSDKLFEGKEYVLVIYIPEEMFHNKQYPILLNLCSITADYYIYCLGYIVTFSGEQALRTLFSEKIPVYNNIKNGYGMFAGNSTSTYSLIVR